MVQHTGNKLTQEQASDVLADAHSGADVSFYLVGTDAEQMGLPPEAYFVSAAGTPENSGGGWYTIEQYRDMLLSDLARVQCEIESRQQN